LSSYVLLFTTKHCAPHIQLKLTKSVKEPASVNNLHTCDVWKDRYQWNGNKEHSMFVRIIDIVRSFRNAFFSSLIEEVVCTKLPLSNYDLALSSHNTEPSGSLDKHKKFSVHHTWFCSIKLSTTSASTI